MASATIPKEAHITQDAIRGILPASAAAVVLQCCQGTSRWTPALQPDWGPGSPASLQWFRLSNEDLQALLRPDVLQGVVEALAQSQHGDKVRFLGVRRIGVDAYGLVDRLGKVLGLFTSKRPHTRAV